MKTFTSKTTINRMRETWSHVRKQMNYKKYTQTLPKFPSNEDLKITENIVRSEQKFVIHNKQTITTMESGKTAKIGKLVCRKDTIVTLIIRNDVPEHGPNTFFFVARVF